MLNDTLGRQSTKFRRVGYSTGHSTDLVSSTKHYKGNKRVKQKPKRPVHQLQYMDFIGFSFKRTVKKCIRQFGKCKP